MASLVEICNEGLSLLGGKSIVSLEENSQEAYACRTHIRKLIETVLSSHPWNCVSERIVLNRLTEKPVFGYNYIYQLPTGFLRINELYPESDHIIRGKKLYTDSDSIAIDCVIYTENTDIFQPELTTGISYLLAGRLCYQMTSSTSLAESLYQRGEEFIRLAKASNSFEGTKRDKFRKSWINAKYRG